MISKSPVLRYSRYVLEIGMEFCLYQTYISLFWHDFFLYTSRCTTKKRLRANAPCFRVRHARQKHLLCARNFPSQDTEENSDRRSWVVTGNWRCLPSDFRIPVTSRWGPQKHDAGHLHGWLVYVATSRSKLMLACDTELMAPGQSQIVDQGRAKSM